ncbi:DUF3971 domain-containing protein [Alphaproteobacteria bacterium]|nr:DUF3971 domain-containing protein [Alphaproteobacteria bacterium]
MIKYNFLKYLLLVLLLVVLLLAGALFRISYKPLEVGFIGKFFSEETINNIFPFSNLENTEVRLNIFKNIISVTFYDIENYDFPTNSQELSISITAAKEINIGLKASKLINNKKEFKYIKIDDAKLSIYSNRNIFDYKKGNINKKKYSFLPEKIEITNSDLDIIFQNQTSYIITKNLEVKATNKYGMIQINNMQSDKINLIEKNKEISLEFIKSSLSFEDNILDGKFLELKVVNLRNDNEISKMLNKINVTSNDFKFGNTNIIYNYGNDFTINSNIFCKGVELPTKITGRFTENLLINANIDFKVNKLRLPKDLSKMTLTKGLGINNLDKFLLDGIASVEIFQNKFLSANLEIKSNINKADLLIGELNYPLNNFFLKANILESQLEIDRILINSSKDEIEIKGQAEDIYNNINAEIDVNTKKISLLFLNDFILKKKNEPTIPFNISNIESGNLDKLNIKFLYNDNEIKIKTFDGRLANTRIALEEDVTATIDEGIIGVNNDNAIILKIKRLSLNKKDKKLELFQNTIEFQNIFKKNINSIVYKSNINTELKKILNFFNAFERFQVSQLVTKHISGKINTELFLDYTFSEYAKYNLNVSGELLDFNLYQNDNFPVIIENFNGNFEFKNNLLLLEGKAYLNKSASDIQIKLNTNYNLQVNVDSLALASSFDFLEDYNFLKTGTTKLNLKIEKNNLFDSQWKAELNANLFNNKVEIKEVVYEKKEKQQGWLKAIYNFNKLKLKHVESLTFLSDDILIRGDIFLGENGNISNIQVEEFRRELDNFSAKINFKDKNYFVLDVFGESININNFFSEKDNDNLSGEININVNKLYFSGLNFGNTIILSEIYENKILKLNGEIFDNKKKYSYFDYFPEKTENNILKLTFLDFGLFLKNINASDKFIAGKGDILFELDNQTNDIVSGKYFVENFNVKDASFLVRLLQLASFTGLLEILASDGIPFSNLQGSFKIKNSKIVIEKTRFEGLSLGASTSGNINLRNKNLNLEGVLIPAYAINTIINKIPLLGQIITGVEGEGIIGFNYKVTGNYEKPEYTINPLSVLTPGIIRSIFKVFDNENQSEINKDNNTN